MEKKGSNSISTAPIEKHQLTKSDEPATDPQRSPQIRPMVVT